MFPLSDPQRPLHTTSPTMPLTAESGSEALRSLQILRGVAAWLVVYHHYMQGFHRFHYSTAVGHFFTVVGNFGVDIFFTISGFIMCYTLSRRHYSAREFLARRVLRIVPVYWFMTFAFILIIYAFPSPFASLFAWDSFSLVLSLLFVPHQNPSGLGQFPLLTVGWTLEFEMFFYVWLGLVLWVVPKRWLGTCVFSLFVLPFLWNRSWFYASILSSNLLSEFAIGMLIAYVWLHATAREKCKGPYLGWVLFVLGVCVYWMGFTEWPLLNFSKTPFLWRFGNITNHISAAMFVCAALSFERHIPRFPALRLFQHLGDISYSTYLVHLLALCIAIYLVGQPQSLFGELVALSAYTAMTLLLSKLSFRWVETGPATEFLKRAFLAPRPGTKPSDG